MLMELEVTLQPSLIEIHGWYLLLGKRGEQLYESLILLPGLKNAFRQAEKNFIVDLKASQFLNKDHQFILKEMFVQHYKRLELSEDTLDYFSQSQLFDKLMALHEHMTTTLTTQCLKAVLDLCSTPSGNPLSLSRFLEHTSLQSLLPHPPKKMSQL